MIAKLNQIIVYPIHSLPGIICSEAQIKNKMLHTDRQWVLTEYSGSVITSYTHPEARHFKLDKIGKSITIIAPDGQTLSIDTHDFSAQPEHTKIGQAVFYSYIASIKINRWFSHYFKKDMQLRYHDTAIPLPKTFFCTFPLFAIDKHPILLINLASFDKLAAATSHSITLDQYQGNLIVSNLPPFVENYWKTVQIGTLYFDVIRAQFRSIPVSDMSINMNFGVYLIPRTEGKITTKDTVLVTEYQTIQLPVHAFSVQQIRPCESYSPKDRVEIEYHDVQFQGNSYQTILEQLEAHNVLLPYACRVGICGRCEVELLEGNVLPLTDTAIRKQNKILACSCRPKGKIKIK